MTITTAIKDIQPFTNPFGKLLSIFFIVTATDEAGNTTSLAVTKKSDSFPVHTGTRVIAGTEYPYSDAELAAIADVVAIEREAYLDVTNKLKIETSPPEQAKPIPAPAPLTDAQKIEMMVGSINDRIAAVYSKFTRFQLEYEMREAEAEAYKEAGYVGTPGTMIAKYAEVTGLTYQQATDATLTIAAQLRGAIPVIGNLRMEQYTVQATPDIATAEAKYNEVLTHIDQIEASLP